MQTMRTRKANWAYNDFNLLRRSLLHKLYEFLGALVLPLEALHKKMVEQFKLRCGYANPD